MAISSWSAGAVNETVGTGQDRVNLTAFEAAHDGETPTTGTLCTALIVGTITGDAVTYQNWQAGQDANTRVVIKASAGQEATGIDNGGGAILSSGDFNVKQFGQTATFLDMQGLEFVDYADVALDTDGGGEIRITKCYFRNNTNTGDQISINGNDKNIMIGGCIFKSASAGTTYRSAIRQGGSGQITPIEVYNCTIYSNGTASGIKGAPIKARNVVSVNGGGNRDFFSVSDEDYCISEDNSATGANSKNNQPIPGMFTVGATDATADLHIKDTLSPLHHAVTPGEPRTEAWFTALCATDIDGVTWNSTPSIGAYEFPGAPAAGKVRLINGGLVNAGLIRGQLIQ